MTKPLFNMEAVRIIGVSSRSVIDRENIMYRLAAGLTEYKVQSFDDSIYYALSCATGIDTDTLKKSDVFNSYLGKEWSYVREERFTENGQTVFKPIRYYLSPKQIFNKLKYDMREIHSNYWINQFFNTYIGQIPPIIIGVQYPNQAEAILERGGIVLRGDNLSQTSPVTREDLLMDTYRDFFKVFTYSGDVEMSKQINEWICHIKKSFPNAFISK
jgi:hypothetical protein